MKITMDYMVGNTAIQIVNTGKKIKVVDVKKRKVRTSIIKHLIIASIVTILLVTSCFYVVHLENTKVMLDKQVYLLQSQIENMEKENIVLRKQQLEMPLDYELLFARAREMGMDFPTKEQIGVYEVEKSTSVRICGNYLND